jgi:hypothetical protein
MDFNKEIEGVRPDLIHSEYPQEFVDSIQKPLRSNRPSDTTYQGTVVIPYVKGISKKFRPIGKCFSSRTILNLNIHSVGHRKLDLLDMPSR